MEMIECISEDIKRLNNRDGRIEIWNFYAC